MARKPITPRLRFEVLRRDGFTCRYCGKPHTDAILEVDHVVPVAEGGETTLDNLVTACEDCNRGKSKHAASEKPKVLTRPLQLPSTKETVPCFSESLKQLRRNRGCTQKQLAKVSGVSERAIRWYEAGDREPSITQLVKIADFFSVSLDELIGRSVCEPSDNERQVRR